MSVAGFVMWTSKEPQANNNGSKAKPSILLVNRLLRQSLAVEEIESRRRFLLRISENDFTRLVQRRKEQVYFAFKGNEHYKDFTAETRLVLSS